MLFFLENVVENPFKKNKKMTKKEIAEILKFSSPNIIYIITWNNILKKMFCPFQVIVKCDIGDLKKNDIVFVDSVKVNLEIKTIYIINSKAYYHHYFDILV